MSEIVITLVNKCDDDQSAQVLVYQSRPQGDANNSTAPAAYEVEVPAGMRRDLNVPSGPRYFVGVEDVGPGGLHPGRRDTLEVSSDSSQTVVVSGSLASGLRISLG